ncbi:MAG: hypothetical protein GEU28_04420 [Dehalococcoidia bacterium]|nr:hypothetical protein [Dehalococcoidia bacterium]
MADKEFKFPIEAGHIMMFARAVGDPNPVYHDEGQASKTEAGQIIAPPTFIQSSAQFEPGYFLRPVPGQPWHGSGKNPSGMADQGAGSRPGGGDVARGLHAEQHYEYHRHPKAGDILTATLKPGKTWEKEGRRGGKLKFTEAVTEYRDQNGGLVVTARQVSVTTEKTPENA